MVNRWYDILKLLVSYKSISIDQLKDKLSFSTQTIRKSIILLNNQLKDIAIVHIDQQLVSLEILDFDKFNIIMSGSLRVKSDYNSQSKRIAYILKQLLEADDYCVTEELAEELLVSRSTIINDLKRAKALLNDYAVSFEGATSKGIRLSGDELDKRLIYLHFVQEYFPFKYIKNESIDFLIKLKDEQKLTRYSANLMMKVLDVMIGRIASGHEMTENIEFYKNMTEKEDVLHDILYHIEVTYSMTLSHYEINFMSFPLNLQNTMQNQVKSIIQDKFNRQIFDTMMAMVEASFAIEVDNDTFYQEIANHLYYLIHRTIFKVKPNEVFFGEIERKYPFAYELARLAVKSISMQIHKEVDPLEIDYLSLYFELLLEKSSSKKRPNVAIISHTSHGTASMIKKQIERVIVDDLDITLINEERYHDVDLSRYSVIFTTIPLPESISDVPIIRIGNVFSDQWLSNEWHNVHMNDVKLFELYLVNLVRAKEELSYVEIIRHLTSELVSQQKVDTDFVERILEKEAKMPTLFENGIAFPHAIHTQSQQIIISLCILDEPIEVEDTFINMIFLLAVPSVLTSEQENNLLEIYDIMFRLANDKAFKHAIGTFENKDDFIQYLRNRREIL